MDSYDSRNVTITSVNLAKAVPFITAHGHGGYDTPNRNDFRAKLTATTTLNLRRALSDTRGEAHNVFWQVVEFEGLKSMQTGDLSFDNTTASLNATISAVNQNKSLLLVSWYTGRGGRYYAATGIKFNLDTQINVSQMAAYGASLNATWWVLEFA